MSTATAAPEAGPILDVTGTADDLAVPARRHRRQLGLLLVLVILVLAVLASAAIGAKPLSLHTVLDAFTGFDPNDVDHAIVRDQRVPRTVLALLVGAALGVAGALMQGLTRNPLADPGLLGVNAGASFAMVLAVAVLPVSTMPGYLGFAFLGAVVTTVAVYLVGAGGRTGGSPVTLALAGVAIGAVLAGLTTTMTLLDPTTFLTMRAWEAGALADRGWEVVRTIAPFVLVGLLLAAGAARGLNAVGLGDDLAVALGVNRRNTRILVVVSVTLLCGAATAAVGPIWFVGLMVPHAVRWIVGPDQRWILAYSLLVGALLMLLADELGRVVVRPDEIAAGIVTAFLGGPVLIGLVRRRRARAL